MSEPALVLAAHGRSAVVQRADGSLAEVHYRRRVGRPLPGDRVEIDAHGAVAAIAPRRTSFGRGDHRGRFRPLAANLDGLVIVIAPEPAPSRDIVHRYLAAAWILGIEPVLVINKSDLEPDDAHSLFAELEQLPVPLFRTRCLPEPRLGALPDRLRGGTHLLAGQSGVGKSSLANALIPDLELQTRELSRVTGKGTHATTTAELHALPGGGWLVDSPGVWEYGLWKMEPGELARGFPEFAGYAGACQFRDCRHAREPGCAVRAAAEAGKLPAFRYRAWLRLLDEQARLNRHS